MTATHKTAPAAHAGKDQRTLNLVDGTTMADALAISSRTMHRLRSRGIIGCYRVGRSIRYNHDEVMASMADYHVMSRAQIAAGKPSFTR